MHFLEALRISLQSLWANKLRSSLTLLGVVIGVAAVIAVVTFVNGINGYVAEKIFNLGADVFIISKVTPVITDVDQLLEGQKRKDLTMEDYHAVLEACRHCVMLGASTFNPNGHVKYNEQSVSDSWIRGLTPAMAQILDLDLAAGRMLNDNDENNRSNVTVIGTDIADNLFPGTDPLNKEIRVEGQIYRIVGIGKKQGKTLGQSRDNYVAIPITTYLKQFGAHTSIRISGKANGVGIQLESAIDEARAILRARRHDLPGRPDSFAAETNASFLSIWANLSGTFFIAMIAIAAISLVVGGIVIMNIMLVSITERRYFFWRVSRATRSSAGSYCCAALRNVDRCHDTERRLRRDRADVAGHYPQQQAALSAHRAGHRYRGGGCHRYFIHRAWDERSLSPSDQPHGLESHYRL